MWIGVLDVFLARLPVFRKRDWRFWDKAYEGFAGGRCGDQPSGFFLPMKCFHCDPAPCVFACPTSAMRKRQDGIVYVDEIRCIGCKACIIACPYGAIAFNPNTMKVEKCDYCYKRLEKGLLPPAFPSVLPTVFTLWR